MPIIQTAELKPHSLNPLDNYQVYNGLDCCVTLEVFEELMLEFPQVPSIYAFERAMQGPYLEIMQRGFRVDESGRRVAALGLRERIDALQLKLDTIARGFWSRPLNPRSPAQLKDFFYGHMKLPEVWISQKGEKKLSTNREALEKLEVYLHARPTIACILAIRDLAKQLEVFETEIDSDGRFRTSYNIAGTETGRPSSSSNAFGTGGNAQNISPQLRWPFIADAGYKIGVVDLEQVEARDVGFFCGCLFGQWRFLDACESGDLHTNNSKLVWPELRWTGNPKLDRAIADQNFYREFSYRDMSKRGGHLSNYYGTAWTMARSLKIPVPVADEFQARYIRGRAPDTKRGLLRIDPAYPEISEWWQWTAQQLQTLGHLTTPFGRKRNFFGRAGDDTTLREAIAFLPQSTTADRMNLGMWRVWRYMPEVQLLAQTYDSITFQYLDKGPEYENQIIQKVLQLIRVELVAPGGRKYTVPGEAKVGWNWGAEITPADQERARLAGRKAPRLNTEGLRKWSPKVPDARQRATGLQMKIA